MNGLGLATGAAVTAGMAAGQVTKAAGQALVAAGTALQTKKLEKQAREEAKKAANVAKLKQLLHLGDSKAGKAAGGAAGSPGVSLTAQGGAPGGYNVVVGAEQTTPAMMYQPLPGQVNANVGTYQQTASGSVQYSQTVPATAFGGAYSQAGASSPYSQISLSQQGDAPQYSQTSESVSGTWGSGELPYAQYSQTSNSNMESSQGFGQGPQNSQTLQRPQQYSLPSETDNDMPWS
jgi:hypothetical protein